MGKAYYYKGPSYADLSIRFLEEARREAYKAGDIPEYLGLAYAAIRDFRSSVAAFTLALDPSEPAPPDTNPVGGALGTPSDLLLLSIARSYIALGEQDTAKAYLVRCIETSRDSASVIAARLLLGGILTETAGLEDAEGQYLAVLEMDEENAEAHYQLGELYLSGGDPTRARAEWRRAVRIDPTHGPARTRLNM